MTYGQIVLYDGNQSGVVENVRIIYTILDKNTSEPIEYATAYLQLGQDSLITSLAISSKQGMVEFKDIPKGSYKLTVEMLGYVSYSETVFATSTSHTPKIIMLEENSEYIDAATITSFVKPMEFSKDTLIYNAMAFKVGTNAVLEDLLKKMPGMEVRDGKVYVNGNAVSEITLNGKTFFFEDQSIALRNLPARIVNRIKIIDKSSENLLSSIRKNSEKTMDVEVKEEYSKGLFGNVDINGGTGQSNTPESNSSSKLLADIQSLLCNYSKKIQCTILARGDNDTYDNGWSAQAGFNINTDKLRNLNTTLSFIAESGKEKSMNVVTQRFSSNESIIRNTISSSDRNVQNYNVSLGGELINSKKVQFEIIPNFTFENFSFERTDYSTSSILESQVSILSQIGNGHQYKGGLNVKAGVLDIGKKGRNLKFTLKHNNQFALELRRDDMLEGPKSDINNASSINLNINESNVKGVSTLNLSYTEPIIERLNLDIIGSVRYNSSGSDKKAYNSGDGSINKSFTSSSQNYYTSFIEHLYLTYQFDKLKMLFGGNAEQTKNVNIIDKGDYSLREEWRKTISPYLYFYTNDYRKRLWLSSYSIPVNGIDIQPSLSRISSSDLSIGNMYLRTSRSYEIGVDYLWASDFKFQATLLTKINNYPITYANWCNESGKRFYFPVNSKKNGITLDSFLSFSNTFGKHNEWYLSWFVKGKVSNNIGYQANDGTEIVKLDSFDYTAFIKEIWGNDKGSLFYSGQSGFKESQITVYDINGKLGIGYRTNAISISLALVPNYYKSLYSLYSKANQDVFNFSISPSLDIILPKDFFVATSLDCISYKGYGESYDRTIWDWSIEISKDIKMLNFSLRASDIFNSSVTMIHRATLESVSNTIAGRLGRKIILGVSWNFGKVNSSAEKIANKFIRSISK